MTDAVIIETDSHVAGVAMRERTGYRFYASDALFRSLENFQFRQLRGLQAAVERICREATRPLLPVAVAG